MRADYFQYWGKARSPAASNTETAAAPYHLLPFHALDVAACAQQLLRRGVWDAQPLAHALSWPLDVVQRLTVFFVALHDVGKFARSFQALAPDLDDALVSTDGARDYTSRHDTLGWWLWKLELAEDAAIASALTAPDASSYAEVWEVWMRSVCGHHGQPPLECDGVNSANLRSFDPADEAAARSFVLDLAALLLSDMPPLPALPSERKMRNAARKVLSNTLQQHSWSIAGLTVLADWLGSDTTHFPYVAQPESLATYWQRAQAQATRAVDAAGLGACALRHWQHPLDIFEHLRTPTPLQEFAANTPLQTGPQLFILEDVTGAGKTEAALTLAQRLMHSGAARGLYFALPTMATANQMFERVGSVWRRWFAADAQPSLVLAHSARELVSGWSSGIATDAMNAQPQHYARDDDTASAQCSAWLADSRKKALLADVGVGTIDQALMAVLPVRHQSLRLLGLLSKVLVVDEVHACDAYMAELLQELLKAHAGQGGCAVLLSATLPLDLREKLLQSWRDGRMQWAATHGQSALEEATYPSLNTEMRYPLAIHAGQQLQVHACETRFQVRRHVHVKWLDSESAALEHLINAAEEGRCAAWIRNTVSDARAAWQACTQRLMAQTGCSAEAAAQRVQLFHSRYAMAHRLEIEQRVLSQLGKHSSAAQRAGCIVIGTQVLEQSLDFDVDEMVSDLAPIDLLIQRAGRLHRHARSAQGDPLEPTETDQRPSPVLHVLSPDPVESPSADWLDATLPRVKYIYPHVGQLWLTARALKAAAGIDTPGELGAANSARCLIEAVYAQQSMENIPEALLRDSFAQEGRALASASHAKASTLVMSSGYSASNNAHWEDDNSKTQIRTRDVDGESLSLYLAVWDETQQQLLPIWLWNAMQSTAKGEAPIASHIDWAQSCVRVHAYKAKALAPAVQHRFQDHIQSLCQKHRMLAAPALVLPLVHEAGSLSTQVLNAQGQVHTLHYDWAQGLMG